MSRAARHVPRIIAEFEEVGVTLSGDDGVVYTGPSVFVRVEFSHGDHARAQALLEDARLDVKAQIRGVAETSENHWRSVEEEFGLVGQD